MSTDDDARLDAAVTPKSLRRIAGERYFERGEDYFAGNAVRSLRWRNGGVEATVRGTHKYRVRLWMEDGQFHHACDCPLGWEGAFCKHCVATGLAWHAESRRGGDDTGNGESASFAEADVRAYLMGLDREELVSLVIEHVDEDERLRRGLWMRAAGAAHDTADLSVWRAAFDDATVSDEFAPSQDAYDHARGIDEVIDSVEEMLRTGRPGDVVELAEYGLATLEESLEYTDDSDGWLYGQLERLQDLHLEACLLAKPDPAALAERLFEQGTESPFNTFSRAASVYAEVLGDAGLAAYYRLAKTEWAKLPALGPGDENPDRYGRRGKITAIMEAYAKESGDLEAVIAVKARDISQPHDFLEIAQFCRDAGDAARALEWAERGWRAFPDQRRDGRLRTFLADAYQGHGRKDEAMALVWEAFAEQPLLQTYRQLEKHARRARGWPGWRDKALTLIRERIAGKAARQPSGPAWMLAPFGDHSLLVDIFLHEGDPDAAWREAEDGGCSGKLWLALAKQREKTHPEDSVRIYKAHVGSLLRNTGNGVYKEATGYLGKIRTLLAGSGPESAFRPILAEIRATHWRKRNLMKMLDGKGW